MDIFTFHAYLTVHWMVSKLPNNFEARRDSFKHINVNLQNYHNRGVDLFMYTLYCVLNITEGQHLPYKYRSPLYTN